MSSVDEPADVDPPRPWPPVVREMVWRLNQLVAKAGRPDWVFDASYSRCMLRAVDWLRARGYDPVLYVEAQVWARRSAHRARNRAHPTCAIPPPVAPDIWCPEGHQNRRAHALDKYVHYLCRQFHTDCLSDARRERMLHEFDRSHALVEAGMSQPGAYLPDTIERMLADLHPAYVLVRFPRALDGMSDIWEPARIQAERAAQDLSYAALIRWAWNSCRVQ